MKRFLKGFLCGMLTTSMMLVVALTIGQFGGYIDLGAAWNRTDQDSTMKREVKQKASTIEKYIDAYYLDDINKDKMENSIYKGIVNGLGDDYAEYYTAEEYAEIMEKTSGTFYGIGAYVTQNTDTGAITIVKPMKNSPAEKAGLKAGDIIYAINDERVSGKDLSAVLAQIKGEEGSKVKLTIVRSRENDYLTFSVKRAKIQEDTVYHGTYPNVFLLLSLLQIVFLTGLLTFSALLSSTCYTVSYGIPPAFYVIFFAICYFTKI